MSDNKIYEPSTVKRSITVPFPGASLEMRNNFTFPAKDPVTKQPTGEMALAKAGLYLHIAGGRTLDLTGINPADIADAYAKLVKKPMAKDLLAEIEATR